MRGQRKIQRGLRKGSALNKTRGEPGINWRKGFTLIELLIVVAIIAILAAIAVPNFLEAQARAKVSRVNADFRTLAVAEEAYRVDWNTYTHTNQYNSNPWDPNGPRRWGGFAELTTPVAYITSIPMSPFGLVWGPAMQQTRQSIFKLGTGNSGNKQNTGLPWASNAQGFPADCFLLDCDGPDKINDLTTTYASIDDQTFPWPQVNPNDAPLILAVIYDPTNGTVSRGQILRVGGQLPGGALYSALYAACSK